MFTRAALARERRHDAEAGLDEAVHRRDRSVEHLPLGLVEFDLDDALDTFGADYDRHADIAVLDTVFALEKGSTGEDALLVPEVALRHGDRGAGGCIEGRAGLEQVDDLGAAVAGPLHDLVEPLPGGPAHADEVGERNAGDGRIADERHHGVAMPAEHEGGHVLDRDLELTRQEIT